MHLLATALVDLPAGNYLKAFAIDDFHTQHWCDGLSRSPQLICCLVRRLKAHTVKQSDSVNFFAEFRTNGHLALANGRRTRTVARMPNPSLPHLPNYSTRCFTRILLADYRSEDEFRYLAPHGSLTLREHRRQNRLLARIAANRGFSVQPREWTVLDYVFWLNGSKTSPSRRQAFSEGVRFQVRHSFAPFRSAFCKKSTDKKDPEGEPK